jgi:hypothetical protein
MELLFAAFNPKYCKREAQNPLMNISRIDPPKEIAQRWKAQQNARMQRTKRG